MTKFRSTAKDRNLTINRAGGQAYKQSDKLELVSLLLTSFLSDKYYESESEQLERLIGLVDKISDKKFLAKSAIYARTQFGMRSITHALIGELVRVVKGEEWVKDAIDKTIYRADDMLEILGYYLKFYGKPIPNNLKKGLALAVHKFDEYQLAKYRGTGKTVKMVDLFNLVHPKPKDIKYHSENDQRRIWHKLMTGELKSFDTWEVELTKAGQKAETEEEKMNFKREAWEKLIDGNKIGYFALLRNLRNILVQAPNSVGKAIEILTDENRIKKSLVLPFRYSTAVKAIEQSEGGFRLRDVMIGIHRACEIALNNVPVFDGKTLVALDESGSMNGRPIEIGSLFASILYKTNNADLISFSNKARFRNFLPTDSSLTIAKRLQEDQVCQGTNFHAIFDLIKDTRYNRIFILSDMQAWMERYTDVWSNVSTKPAQDDYNDYCNRLSIRPFVYSFDLQGYGDMQFPERNVFCIAGFSDKIFDIVKLLETDKNALINEIDKIEL